MLGVVLRRRSVRMVQWTGVNHPAVDQITVRSSSKNRVPKMQLQHEIEQYVNFNEMTSTKNDSSLIFDDKNFQKGPRVRCSKICL